MIVHSIIRMEREANRHNSLLVPNDRCMHVVGGPETIKVMLKMDDQTTVKDAAQRLKSPG